MSKKSQTTNGNKVKAPVGKQQTQKGPRPQFKPRIVPMAPIQKDPMIIYNGWSGLVESPSGVRLCVGKRTSRSGGNVFKVIEILNVPVGSELQGINMKVYLYWSSIHRPFTSKLPLESNDRVSQKRIWEFLDLWFRQAGIKQADHPSMENVEHNHNQEVGATNG